MVHILNNKDLFDHTYNDLKLMVWNCSYVCTNLLLLLLLSHFSHVKLYVTPETETYQAPPSLGFPRQGHWSGLPFPSTMHESEK